MDPLSAYLPTDRRHALLAGRTLSAYTRGTALLADISGFTPLSEALVIALGPQRGAEELSRHLNTVYEAVIAQVDRYRGSVLVFSGDAITCWFDGDGGRRAVTCGLAMQAAMRPFAGLATSAGVVLSLAMKVAIAAGPARRFIVGDPAIQRLDVLGGATLDRMAAGEKHAQRGEVVVDAATLADLKTAMEDVRDVSHGQGNSGWCAVSTAGRHSVRGRRSPPPRCPCLNCKPGCCPRSSRGCRRGKPITWQRSARMWRCL